MKNYFYPDDFRNFPIPKITKSEQNPFIQLVDKILSAKDSNPSLDTTLFEAEIDRMAYKLYGLTEAEIAIVEESVGR